MILRIFILSLCWSLCAEEIDPSSIISTENEPSVLVDGKVNAITGRWCATERDLIIRGAEPIVISRTYNKSEDWKFDHFIHVEETNTIYHNKASFLITESTGSQIEYRFSGQTSLIQGQKYKRYTPGNLTEGYTNTGRGSISGRTNLHNNVLLVGPKDKNIILQRANGSVRAYHKIHKGDGKYNILSEHLPNGNWILYDYKEVDLGKDKNPIMNVTSIRTTNPNRQRVYARADFIYEDPKRKNKHFYIKGSDGQIVEYCYVKNSKDKQTGSLFRVISSSAPARQYNGASVSLPLGRTMRANHYTTDNTTVVHGQTIKMENYRYNIDPDRDEPIYRYVYDPRCGLVKEIASPSGADPTPLPTHWFIYDLPNRKTSVFDVEDQRTDYHWNGSYRLQRIAHHDKSGSLINVKRFTWSETGSLLCTSLLDSNRRPYRAKRYTYDNLGNVLEERIFGNLSGKGSPLNLDARGLPIENGVESSGRRCTYHAGRISTLRSEEDDRGRRIEYSYLPNTDRLASQLTYDHNELKQRKFWLYNTDGILIRESLDDGSSPDPENMTGVKQRLIVKTTLNPDGPYVDMPWIIEEKYWEQGQERLIHKTVLKYTTEGRIGQRDHYDAEGRLSYSLLYKYDSQGRLIEETDPMGRSQKFTYDECGNKISHKPYSGRTHADFTFDYSDHLTSSYQIGDDGITLCESFVYDRKHRLIHEEKPLGYFADYGYDLSGNLIKKELPPLLGVTGSKLPNSFTYVYDSFGRCLEATDPEGHTTKTTYNAYDQPTRIEHPDGSSEDFLYDLDGRLSSSIDPDGIKNTFAYDVFGRQVSKIVSHSGRTLSEEFCEYDAFHLIAKIDPEGNRTTYEYDGAGRLASVQLAAEITEYAYDSLGRQSQEVKGDLHKIKEYDLLDRVIEELQENSRGSLLHRIQYAYDAAGNQSEIIRSIDGKEATERAIYDSIDRPIQKIDPLGSVIEIRYEETPLLKETTIDPLGLRSVKHYNSQRQIALIEIIDPKGKILNREECYYDFRGKTVEQISCVFDPPRTISTQRRYDSMGRLSLLTEAAGSREERTSTFSYDAKGLLLRATKPDGMVLTYSYTPLGCIASLTSSDSSINYAYSHDRLGRLLTSTDMLTGQATEKAYDPLGRIVQETLGSGHSLLNVYDPSGRRIELLLPDRSFVRYDYNACYLTSVSRYNTIGKELYTHCFNSYDLNGNLLEEELIGNLGTVSHSFNARGQQDSVISPYASHEILERDRIGNVQKARLNGSISNYSYDDLYQLTAETGDYTHSYAHDAHHCRLQKDAETYEINHLLQIPSHLDYDSRGNPTKQGEVVYTYDALDRLTAVESPTTRIQYTYDSEHRRLSKTIFAQERGSWRETGCQSFLYDGQNEIGSFDKSGRIYELRILGLAPQAELGASIAIELNDKVYVPVHDLRSNVMALISLESGQPECSYLYSAFGEEISKGNLTCPWRFSSKRTEDETGLIYYGRRYYSPQIGRWLTPDPAGCTDGLNLYAFVKNNPLTYVDLYGLYYDDHASSVHFQEFCRPDAPGHRSGNDSPFNCPSEHSEGTINYHCGVYNSQEAVFQGTQTLFETLGGNYTTRGHWIHNEGLFSGLLNVGFGKLCKNRFSATNVLLACTGMLGEATRFAMNLNYSDVKRAIDYEASVLSSLADEVISSNNDNLKQVHVSFSNAGFVLNEALPQLTPEQRDTIILITAGTTQIIGKNAAHKVYNLIGNKDWPSIVCNGGRGSIERAKDWASVKFVPQNKTQFGIGGHYNNQPDYQNSIRGIINDHIKGSYEILR
jgi:RHS repeat-associated protein